MVISLTNPQLEVELTIDQGPSGHPEELLEMAGAFSYRAIYSQP